ncbi:MAG: hypothetical protein JW765_13700 [Deltaproteobacteria bacterium]|nr:hypothetical protein [Candidatus Zymogenaceae bacterium]
MSGHEKSGIKKLFISQVILSFIVITVLIILGGVLVFNVMGKDYTQFTVMGFLATVFFAFIVFQPNGTLFAARVELIREKAEAKKEEKTSATAPIANPLLKTAIPGIIAATGSTGIMAAIIYGLDWTPSPVVTVLLSMVFVIPLAIIIRIYIYDDISGMAAAGPFSAKSVTSKGGYIWSYYILPTFVMQLIINMPLANRGFSIEAAKDAASLVPTAAMALDYAVTFMFICNFVFLAVSTYALSDMYVGKFSYTGKARGINGFVYFLLMLLMGGVLGVVFAGITAVLGIEKASFPVALAGKFLTVLLSVYLGCRLAVGWTGKRFNDAVAKKMAEMKKVGKR